MCVAGRATPARAAETTQWLQYTFRDESPILQVVKECFQARKKVIFQTLTDCSKDGQDECFTSLRHHIGRLGLHVKYTNSIYNALEKFPRLLDNFKVEPLPASRPAKFPLVLSGKRFEGMAGRMFKADQKDEAARCQKKLLELSRCFPGGLLEFLNSKCVESTIVHAELQLLDYARHQNVEFVDDDKYIGCSKPACYACYHYFLELAPEYRTVVPPSHYKLYPGWRVPDVPKLRGEAAAKLRDKIMDKMNDVFRAHLIREIDGRGKRPYQFDSTTGVGSQLYDVQPRPAPIQEDRTPSTGVYEAFLP